MRIKECTKFFFNGSWWGRMDKRLEFWIEGGRNTLGGEGIGSERRGWKREYCLIIAWG